MEPQPNITDKPIVHYLGDPDPCPACDLDKVHKVHYVPTEPEPEPKPKSMTVKRKKPCGCGKGKEPLSALVRKRRKK